MFSKYSKPQKIHLGKTKMAIEKQRFEDVSLIKDGDFPLTYRGAGY